MIKDNIGIKAVQLAYLDQITSWPLFFYRIMVKIFKKVYD